MRLFKTFQYKDASYRISPSEPDSFYKTLTKEIIKIRLDLEKYIKKDKIFLESLKPVKLLDNAPNSAIIMEKAARKCGIGPMAAVAGTIAMLSAFNTKDLAEKENIPEIIIENGGDIFILPITRCNTIIAGIFSGLNSQFSNLALKLKPEKDGLAICSSSSKMGHSLSLGDCDLCTVISKNAALADSAATLGCNMVKTEDDLKPAADKIGSIPGVTGVIIIKNDKLAIAGKIPEIIYHKDPRGIEKITKTFFSISK